MGGAKRQGVIWSNIDTEAQPMGCERVRPRGPHPVSYSVRPDALAVCVAAGLSLVDLLRMAGRVGKSGIQGTRQAGIGESRCRLARQSQLRLLHLSSLRRSCL